MIIFARMNPIFMHRCMELALRGAGRVSPNPLVGCVIVHKNQIIGEGYHQKYGEAHAEVNAIANVNQPELLKDSTLYVNLEPCAHYGKTPPCAPMIVGKKIPRVVIANRDPFNEVNGKGIDILRAAGVEVTVGCEKVAGGWLNRRFFTFHQKKRPYIILKFAQSADGFLDKNRAPEDIGVNWITAPETQYLTHRWRSEEDAILIGTQTALKDNPSLTTRRVEGTSPTRLLIDRELRVPKSSKIFKPDAATVVFNSVKSTDQDHIKFVKCDFEKPLLPQITEWCHDKNIMSIMVEGGAATLQRFIDLNLWDESRILTGEARFDEGLAAPKPIGQITEQFIYGPDSVTILTPIK